MKKLLTAIGCVALGLVGVAQAYEGFQNMAYMNYPPVWLRGHFNHWGKTPLVLGSAYKYSGYTSVGYINIPHGKQEFKFDLSKNGDWSSNQGDLNYQDYCLDANGGNLSFTQGAGTYEVRYNTGVSGYGCGRPYFYTQKLNDFVATYRSMYLRGTITNWSLLPMVLVKDHVWEGPIIATPNTYYEFKFDAHGDWSENFGRPVGSDPRANTNYGYAGPAGGNIPFYVEDYSGQPNLMAYIRFNDKTKEYALCPNASKPICQ